VPQDSIRNVTDTSDVSSSPPSSPGAVFTGDTDDRKCAKVASFAAPSEPGNKSTVNDKTTTTSKAKLPNGSVVETLSVDHPGTSLMSIQANYRLQTETVVQPSDPFPPFPPQPYLQAPKSRRPPMNAPHLPPPPPPIPPPQRQQTQLNHRPITSRRTSTALSRHTSTRSHPGSGSSLTSAKPNDAKAVCFANAKPTIWGI
jgi:hypothetical protein